MPGRRSPGLAGDGDAQCVLCNDSAAVSLGGVSAAQSGGQPDADEGLRFPEEIEPEERLSGAVEECIFTQLERERDAMSALFGRNRDRLMELCPDFGTSVVFDGKKLHSHSTGRTRSDGTCSDSDANWGRQAYRREGSDGKPWSHEVKLFGYRLHLVADTRHELPFDFRVEAASVSETPVCREMMSEILVECGDRCTLLRLCRRPRPGR